MTASNETRTTQLTDRNLNILTYNVNGLSEEKKRRKIFQQLENKNAHIILLQETHSNKQIIQKWKEEWKGSSFWHSSGTFKSCGVAILFSKNLNIQNSTISADEEGRILSISFTLEKQTFQITNIYAPTNPSARKNSTKIYYNT